MYFSCRFYGYMFATYMPNSLLTSSHHFIVLPPRSFRTNILFWRNLPYSAWNGHHVSAYYGGYHRACASLTMEWADVEKRLLMAIPSNLWPGRDLLITSCHWGTFLWKKLTILLTSPIRSTLQSGLLVKRNFATITKIIKWWLKVN